MGDNNARRRRDLMLAGAGAMLSVLVLGTGMVLIGQVSGGEARQMLESMMPTTRFLCSAVMGAAATILALMLTMLGLSSSTDDELRGSHYQRILQIAFGATATFIAATALLCFHSVPFGESAQIEPHVFRWIYYALLGGSALLGGTLTAVVLLLYFAVRDMTFYFSPGADTNLIAEPDED